METVSITLILLKAEELRNVPDKPTIINLKNTTNYLFTKMKETNFDYNVCRAYHNYRTELLNELF